MATFDIPFFTAQKFKRGPRRFLYKAVKISCTARSHNPDYLRFRGNVRSYCVQRLIAP
jgi:hypothetical protein